MQNKLDFSKTAIYYYTITSCTDQRDDYTTGCLLYYPYFKENLKLIAIDLSKQKALDANPKTIQQINSTGNLEQPRQKTMFFILEEVKEAILDFPRGTVRVL